jgi:MFS family permease
VVLALERDWGMPYAELFALSIPGAVMFGAGALPAGWLGDRWSATGMMAVFFFGTGIAAVLTGFARTPLELAVGLTAIGSCAAIYHPVGIPWLIRHARSRGRALGISGVFGSAGTAAAALVAGALADLYGWRAAFIVPGLVCLATGVAFVALLRLGLIADGEGEAAPTPAPSRAEVRRAFTALAVTVLCVGVIYQATSYALPKIFEERLAGFVGGSVLGIGGVVTACYLLSGLTQLIGGELADRFPQKTVYMLCQLAQVPLYALAFFLFGASLLPVAFLMIAFNVMGQPAENALLARYTPMKWRGQVFGAKFVLTLGVSSLGVAVIPLIHAATGSLDGLFVLLGASALISFLGASMLPTERREARLAASRAGV